VWYLTQCGILHVCIYWVVMHSVHQ